MSPSACPRPMLLNVPPIVSLTNAQIDGLLKNEAFRMRVDRDHDHADDDMVGNAEIHSIYIRES